MEYQILHPEIDQLQIRNILAGERDHKYLAITYFLANYHEIEENLRRFLSDKIYCNRFSNILMNLDSYIERLVARGLITVRPARG
jgi:hypothetical protein